MKRTITVFILLFIVALFGFSMYYLYMKNKEAPIIYKTEKPSVKTVVDQTVATGNIVPEEEIDIKPNISGIIDTVYVEAGDLVKAGDLLARLRVVPDVGNLANSKNQISSAKIELDNQEKLYNRQRTLYEKGVISANEFDEAQRSYNQAQQSYASAQETYDIIKTGSSKGLGSTTNTNIRATISGMVLDVPVKAGNQVIQANNFNEGTTIASLADVGNMIFEGKIDESEVGKIKTGLPLEITIGALQGKVFDADLFYIAPKADKESTTAGGAVQFEIKGRLKNADNVFIRAGLSANASIILEKAEDVLTIPEALVQFDSRTNQPFVEIETGDQEFDRKDVTLGISDGISVEIKSGLTENEDVKVWNPIVKMKFN